jgi:polysaccharide pyruvyl transferase WcaK-like protein
VLSRAKSILPAVDLITLRGHSAAKVLLESLGVAPSRIQMTGDEAIELAYVARPPSIGSDLGVNFRLRTSAETNDGDIEMLRPILHKFAREHQVSLIPAPIAVDSSTSDYSAIKQLLQGFDDNSDGGARLGSPSEVIRQIGRCRVLVTCAYHAAVFAMAQGIPVVALAKSSYFVEKFLGLKERFGPGCEIVYLDRPDVAEAFRETLEATWRTAEDVHVSLQQSAICQIQAGWKAYNQFKEMATNRIRAAQ